MKFRLPHLDENNLGEILPHKKEQAVFVHFYAQSNFNFYCFVFGRHNISRITSNIRNKDKISQTQFQTVENNHENNKRDNKAHTEKHML